MKNTPYFFLVLASQLFGYTSVGLFGRAYEWLTKDEFYPEIWLLILSTFLVSIFVSLTAGFIRSQQPPFLTAFLFSCPATIICLLYIFYTCVISVFLGDSDAIGILFYFFCWWPSRSTDRGCEYFFSLGRIKDPAKILYQRT
jgi:hypothetical protein